MRDKTLEEWLCQYHMEQPPSPLGGPSTRVKLQTYRLGLEQYARTDILRMHDIRFLPQISIFSVYQTNYDRRRASYNTIRLQ